MRINDTLDPRIKRALESDNLRALREMTKNRPTFTIPMHTANMRMVISDTSFNSSFDTSIRPTIIPEMVITVNPHAIKDHMIANYGVNYTIAANGQAFPLAHVYNGSGALCLGSIFVPSYIPKYSPQQPLETLFLHNDRHVAHGRPVLPLSQTKIRDVSEILYQLDPVFPVDIHHRDWIKKDTLWRIGEQLLLKYPKDQAFRIMHNIFTIIFGDSNE